MSTVKRVLVPVGGRRDHSRLRARLLGSLRRSGERTITYCRILAEGHPAQARDKARRGLDELVRDEVPGPAEVLLVESEDAIGELVRLARDFDLLVLGVERRGSRVRAFGAFTRDLVAVTQCPLILISGR